MAGSSLLHGHPVLHALGEGVVRTLLRNDAEQSTYEQEDVNAAPAQDYGAEQQVFSGSEVQQTVELGEQNTSVIPQQEEASATGCLLRAAARW